MGFFQAIIDFYSYYVESSSKVLKEELELMVQVVKSKFPSCRVSEIRARSLALSPYRLTFEAETEQNKPSMKQSEIINAPYTMYEPFQDRFQDRPDYVFGT